MNKLKEMNMYLLWLCLYILCVWLGTIQNPQGLGKAVLVVMAVVFFIPGGVLAAAGIRQENRKLLLRLRMVCIVSLSLTAVLLVANFLSAGMSTQMGNALYDILALVSAPMLCGQYWALSLFLWAVLLMVTIPGVILPRKKKK